MKDVEIYPSSWYYNACVHGFLEVIAWGLGDRGKDIVEEQFLQNDGSVLIPRELMEAIFSTEDIPAPSGYELREVPDEVNTLKRIAWWWVKISNKVEDDNPEVILESTRRSMFGSNKTFYPNLLPHNQKISTKEFLNDWFSFITEGEVNCSFCNMPCQHAENQAEKMYFFNNCISKHLGSTLNKIPNLYWDTQPNIIMCPLCRSYMLFFHIIQEKNIYVNTELIFLNWHLNNFVEQKYKKEKSYQQTFLEALRYDTQMRKTLGVWGLQNLELIIMEWGNITVQPITERLASLLLIPKVGNLLNLLSNS
ncbi:MAG TPA: type I-B CRISPR-associated protein Cas8b1/Cst1, partial [Syntrophomonadaceae bacterium]|nr:type I-B CRISPR-associated protein Cas8b1/Cst1 [Syntrophomonadaceae bacterium]